MSEIKPERADIKELQVKLKVTKFTKLKTLSIIAPKATLVIPRVRVLLERGGECIRVPLLEPIPIQRYTQLYPTIELKSPQDISVRCLREPEPIAHSSVLKPSVTLDTLRIYPQVLAPITVRPSETSCVPKMRVPLGTSIEEATQERAKIGLRELQTTPIIATQGEELKVSKEYQLYEEASDFYEKAVGCFSGLKGIYRPVCVILSKHKTDSYVHSLALVCRELYRIKRGGKPRPRWLSRWSKEEIEEFMRAGESIFVVDDSKCEVLPNFSKVKLEKDAEERVRESKFLDRLHELFSQDYGFVILHVPKRWSQWLYKLLKERAHYYIPALKLIEPKSLHPYVRKRLAEMCWGFVDTEGRTFDELFGNAERGYYERLAQANQDVELKLMIEEDPDASFEHESLKVITVKALAKELGAENEEEILRMLKEGVIQSEYEFEGGKADIHVSPRHFIEIETFYGVEDPVRKLKKTLSKYLNKSVRVSIVVQGLHMLLFLKELIEFERFYKQEHEVDLNFYTIDLKEYRLVSLKEFLKMLRELSTYPREGMGFDEAKRVYERKLRRKLSNEDVVKHYKEDCEKYGWEAPMWCSI